MSDNKAEKPRSKVQWSAADRARHAAIREKFRNWHPSPEELIASGEGAHFDLRGEYRELRPLVEEIRRAQAVHPVTSVQSELSLWTPDALTEVLPYCQEQGIAFLAFSPLGRGFLAGRFSSFDELPRDDFRRGLPRFQQEALRANLAIVARVREIAERAAATPAQVALAWVLAHGEHVVPIPGTKTPEYLIQNAGAAVIRLSADDLAELDALPAPLGTRY